MYEEKSFILNPIGCYLNFIQRPMSNRYQNRFYSNGQVLANSLIATKWVFEL